MKGSIMRYASLLLLLIAIAVWAAPPVPPVQLTVKPVKLLYNVGEPVTAIATVTNNTKAPLTAAVQAWLEWQLDGRTKPQQATITVAAGKSATATFTWKKLPVQFGYAVKATAQAGEQALSSEDYFQVTDNYWKTAVIAAFGTAWPDGIGYPEAYVARRVKELRASYFNGYEWFFWAPDEVVDMTPEQAAWYSSVGHYPESREGTIRMVAGGHAQGIRAIVYERYSGGGSAGLEAVRRHPEWVQSSEGVLGIDRQVQQFEEWDKEKPTNSRGWIEIRQNLSQPDLFEHSVQELAESTRIFGWDGARWDGTYKEPTEWYNPDGTLGGKLTPEQAEAKNADNMRRYKEAARKVNPHFVVGVNWYGLDYVMSSNPRETAEICRGGGIIMNEWIRNSADLQEPLHLWANYARYLAEDVERAKRMGGYYGPILDIHNHASADSRYKVIFALAAGAHPYYDTLWGAFITRYSDYLWDPALTRIATPQPLVSVPDTVWWKHWVFERRQDATHKQLIIHLVNPPTHPGVGESPKAEDLPKPLAALPVTFLPPLTDGWTPVRVTRLNPEPMTCDTLPLRNAEGGACAISVPELPLWNILVIDLVARKGAK
jgi:hypothetical protein